MRCDYFHRQPRDARFVIRAFNRAIPPMSVCKQHITMASVMMLRSSGAGFVTIGFIEEAKSGKARTKARRGNAESAVHRVRGIRDLPEL